MNFPGVKRCGVVLGASLLVSLFWACSQEDLLTTSLQEDAVLPAGTDAMGIPDTAEKLLPDSAELPPPDTVVRDSVQEQEDEFTDPVKEKDTVFFMDTLVVYRDTVYDTTEVVTRHYTSFVYRLENGLLDTVLSKSAQLDCDVRDSAFSCSQRDVVFMKDLCCGPLDFIKYDSLGDFVLVGEERVFIDLVDTLYLDTLHLPYTHFVYDTTFINYTENRQTDFIPPEFYYDASAHPFDSTEIRSLLDTLDFSSEGKGVTIGVCSDLDFHDLPGIVMVLGLKGSDGSSKLWRTWPSVRMVKERRYSFTSAGVDSDTTVTWTLGYTHYENGVEQSDSIEVTTFIKVE